MKNRIALIVPWSGPRPWYWNLWLASAANHAFDILPLEHPLSYFEQRINTLLNTKLETRNYKLETSYKLCDFRPLFGELFAPELAGYDYWAYGDCDVLYGSQIDAWLDKVLKGGYDVATVQANFCAGPFTLVRNTPRLNGLWREAQGLEQVLGARQLMAFDELGSNWFRKYTYGKMSYADLRVAQPSFSALVWNESEAGHLKLLAEQLIDEHALAKGEMVPLGGDYALYHFISAKLQFGFSRVERGEQVGVGLSRGKAVRDMIGFVGELLYGKKRAWYRVQECVARKCGSKTWWHNYPWNNR